MSLYDSAIENAVAKRERARHVDAKLQAVDGQLRDMRTRVEQLRQSVAKEESDVERLEGVSFASFIARISGKAEEKLSQERMEAYYTRVRLNADTARLEQLERDHSALRQERAAVGDPEVEYAQALVAKERDLAQSGDPAAVELSRIAEERARIEEQLREHDEARAAGAEAEQVVNAVVERITGAKKAQTWDTVTDGGLIGAIAGAKERRKLEDAERQSARAQRLLDTFAAEMADVGIPADIEIPQTPASFQLMETFFDNVFTDMSRRDDLERSRRDMVEVGDAVRKLLGRVDEERAVLERRRQGLIEERTRVISAA